MTIHEHYGVEFDVPDDAKHADLLNVLSIPFTRDQWDLYPEVVLVSGGTISVEVLAGDGDAIGGYFESLGPEGLPDEVEGVFVFAEGWRHLTFEEACEVEESPVHEAILELRAAGETLDKDSPRWSALRDRYYQVLRSDKHPTPSQMPEELRKEVRGVHGIMRDCVVISVQQDGRDASVIKYYENDLYELAGDPVPAIGRITYLQARALGLLGGL